ncbi:MAG TPA: thioesterase family protein [Rhodospirillales bacterium]|jgi:acyl-CoA thioester hydrolase|nr:thioesterase family protein [Rhodospirillales bacterium]|tara:strand:+ start:110 stop:604 length:495 start_codon:yes stop_codon:yes gene_type:complete
MADIIMPDGGRLLHEEQVQPAWVDYNGHMNVAYYVLVFDHGTDALLDLLDMGDDYRKKTNSSDFVVESHISYMREVVEGDSLQIATLLMGFDEKRMHLFHHMYHRNSGFLCATNELMMVHVDMESRRSALFPEVARQGLQIYSENQEPFQRPAQSGSVIEINNH